MGIRLDTPWTLPALLWRAAFGVIQILFDWRHGLICTSSLGHIPLACGGVTVTAFACACGGDAFAAGAGDLADRGLAA